MVQKYIFFLECASFQTIKVRILLPKSGDVKSFVMVKIPTNDYCVIEKKVLILHPNTKHL